jgi:hypothetical protein
MHHQLSTKARHAAADKNNGTAGFFVGSSTLERMRFDLGVHRKKGRIEHAKRMEKLVGERQLEEMEEIARRQAISTQNKVQLVSRKHEAARLLLADKASLRWQQLVNMRDTELKM